jgi:hypothetical protein
MPQQKWSIRINHRSAAVGADRRGDSLGPQQLGRDAIRESAGSPGRTEAPPGPASSGRSDAPPRRSRRRPPRNQRPKRRRPLQGPASLITTHSPENRRARPRKGGRTLCGAVAGSASLRYTRAPNRRLALAGQAGLGVRRPQQPFQLLVCRGGAGGIGHAGFPEVTEKLGLRKNLSPRAIRRTYQVRARAAEVRGLVSLVACFLWALKGLNLRLPPSPPPQ